MAHRRGLIFWKKSDAEWYRDIGNELSMHLDATFRSAIILAVKLAKAGYSYGLITQEVAGDKQHAQYGWFDSEGNVPFTGQATSLFVAKELAFVDDETPAH